MNLAIPAIGLKPYHVGSHTILMGSSYIAEQTVPFSLALRLRLVWTIDFSTVRIKIKCMITNLETEFIGNFDLTLFNCRVMEFFNPTTLQTN